MECIACASSYQQMFNEENMLSEIELLAGTWNVVFATIKWPSINLDDGTKRSDRNRSSPIVTNKNVIVMSKWIYFKMHMV